MSSSLSHLRCQVFFSLRRVEKCFRTGTIPWEGSFSSMEIKMKALYLSSMYLSIYLSSIYHHHLSIYQSTYHYLSLYLDKVRICVLLEEDIRNLLGGRSASIFINPLLKCKNSETTDHISEILIGQKLINSKRMLQLY